MKVRAFSTLMLAVPASLLGACGSDTTTPIVTPGGSGGVISPSAGTSSGGNAGSMTTASTSSNAGNSGTTAGASASGAGGATGLAGGAGTPVSAGSGGALGGTGHGGSSGSGVGGLPTVVDGGTDAASFHCVNWAVNGDNFQTGPLLLSGIFDDDTSYEAVTKRASAVEDAFIAQLKANTFRMPINEPTVNNAEKWNAYKAIIDVGIARNMKVVISFWAKDTGIGRPANVEAWYQMWKTVIDAYVASPTVYFDIHNEPHGYDTDQWVQQVKDWLAKFPNVPKNRIIVAGSGWDTNVYKVDQAFPDLLLEVHDYVFNTPTNGNTWVKQLLDRSSQGNYSRTIVGEWGTGVRPNTDFSKQGDSDFMVAFANTIKTNKMGSCWWPGLWAIPGNTSSWSLLNMDGTKGAGLSYSVQNPSAMARIWHSWGLD